MIYLVLFHSMMGFFFFFFIVLFAFIHFLQELMDVGSSEEWAKVPPCTWSPIPPPELRGEHFEDLSTNGGFVSFGILITANHKFTQTQILQF
jgi:hypothetical protein